MRIANDEILTSPGDLSTDFQSTAIWIGHAHMYSIQLLFTGSINGDFKLQASNDPGKPNNVTELTRDNIQNWTEVADSTQRVMSAGDHLYSIEASPYRWVRVVFERTSGSGSLTSIRFNSKGV